MKNYKDNNMYYYIQYNNTKVYLGDLILYGDEGFKIILTLDVIKLNPKIFQIHGEIPKYVKCIDPGAKRWEFTKNKIYPTIDGYYINNDEDKISQIWKFNVKFEKSSITNFKKQVLKKAYVLYEKGDLIQYASFLNIRIVTNIHWNKNRPDLLFCGNLGVLYDLNTHKWSKKVGHIPVTVDIVEKDT
jgi:hypothetical protein